MTTTIVKMPKRKVLKYRLLRMPQTQRTPSLLTLIQLLPPHKRSTKSVHAPKLLQPLQPLQPSRRNQSQQSKTSLQDWSLNPLQKQFLRVSIEAEAGLRSVPGATMVVMQQRPTMVQMAVVVVVMVPAQMLTETLLFAVAVHQTGPAGWHVCLEAARTLLRPRVLRLQLWKKCCQQRP